MAPEFPQLDVRRAYFFEPEPSSSFWMPSHDKPEPVKIVQEPNTYLSFTLI